MMFRSRHYLFRYTVIQIPILQNKILDFCKTTVQFLMILPPCWYGSGSKYPEGSNSLYNGIQGCARRFAMILVTFGIALGIKGGWYYFSLLNRQDWY